MSNSKRRYWITFALGILAILLLIATFFLLPLIKSDVAVFIWAAFFILWPVVVNGAIAREKGISIIAGTFLGLIFSVLANLLFLILPYSSGRKRSLTKGYTGSREYVTKLVGAPHIPASLLSLAM